jgi:membrane protein required for colicin V production
MNFTIVDFFYLAIILMFSIIAACNGFIKELFSKLAFIAGIITAIFLAGWLSAYLSRIIKNKTADTIIACILLFAAAYLLVSIIQHIFSGVFGGDILKGLDRTLGFFFGAAEGIVIVAAVLIIVSSQPWFKLSVLTENSFFYALLKPIIARPVYSLSGVFA